MPRCSTPGCVNWVVFHTKLQIPCISNKCAYSALRSEHPGLEDFFNSNCQCHTVQGLGYQAAHSNWLRLETSRSAKNHKCKLWSTKMEHMYIAAVGKYFFQWINTARSYGRCSSAHPQRSSGRQWQESNLLNDSQGHHRNHWPVKGPFTKAQRSKNGSAVGPWTS